MKNLFLQALSLLLLISCNDDQTPKPRGYFRIDLPPKQYDHYSEACPFEFEKPVYSRVVQDSSASAEPCWLNLDFLPYNATLHLTYKPIGEGNNLVKLQEDTRKLVYKHTIKAEEIFENHINRPEEKVYGVLYDLRGNTATALQFYVTDSSKHYLRGVLYFNMRTVPDSIAPVQQYLNEDVFKLIGSIRWK